MALTSPKAENISPLASRHFSWDKFVFNDENTTQPVNNGDLCYVNGTGFRFKQEGTVYTLPTSSVAGASKALDDLASVAINTSLISDTDNTDDLGSNSKEWKDLYIDGVGYIDTLQTDLIQEDTGGNGVVIDGVTCKDNGLSFTGDIAVNTNKFTVTGSNGNTLVAGTFEATGASTLTGNVGCAGTLTVDGTSTLTGNVSCGGDLTVSGSFTFGGALSVNETLTVDELVLDTDGVAPAGTNCYAVRDNSGDLTVNAITGKEVHIAINNTDEYDFSATIADFNGNAIDNAGYIILNAATAPGGTEVYVAHDNTGDLTVNAKTGKVVHIAIAGADEYDFSGTQLDLKTNTLTGSGLWTPAGGIALADQKLDITTGYIEFGTTPASAGDIRQENNVYIASARNAGNDGDVDIIKANASDLIEFGASLAATTMGATLTIAAQQISATTGNLTFSGAGHVSIGANPASAGYIRLSNNVDIAARNAANGGDINMVKVNASDDVEVGADLQLAGNKLYGATGANGNLLLESTVNATKGRVITTDGDEGIGIGESADRAGAVGDNVLHIGDGAAAPAGALANGISIYSEGGECKVLDAAGNSTTLSPHTKDGDFIIKSFSIFKDETILIHLEKLVKALVKDHRNLRKYVEVL